MEDQEPPARVEDQEPPARVEDQEPPTLAFQSSDGTAYEIPVHTADEARQLLQIAQGVWERFAGDGLGLECGAPCGVDAAEPDAIAEQGGRGGECGSGGRAAPGDIDTAIDVLVVEGVRRENIMREPWVTFVPQGFGWGDALRPPPPRHHRCTRWADHCILQSDYGTVILDEAAANIVPGGTILRPSVAFYCPHRLCRWPHVLNLDGPWYCTREGRAAAVRRNKEYLAAELQEISIPVSEYPLDTWVGMLRGAIRGHMRHRRRPGPARR